MRLIAAVPSMVTLAALCCGISAVRCASLGEYGAAVACLAAAAICDGLDGHVARILKATSQFGAELDSLCDLVDFGVAPCLVMHMWAYPHASPWVSDALLWIGCLTFCCACALRLARFNMTHALAPKAIAPVMEEEEIAEEEAAEGHGRARRGSHHGHHGHGASAAAALSDPPPKLSMRHRLNNSTRRMMRGIKTSVARRSQQMILNYVTREKFFEGTPAPVAGALCLMPMIISFEFGVAALTDARLVVFCNMIVISFLMVSTIPTLSSKMLMRNPHKESHLRSRSLLSFIGKVALVSATAAAAYWAPWKLSMLLAAVYAILLPIGPIVYRNCED